MRIGLFGLNIVSGNMGCQALAYSFLHLLNKTKKDRNITCYLFLENDLLTDEIERYGELEICPVLFRIKDKQSMKKLNNCIKQCDLVFDFTEGDSFSDIYGMNRMIKVSLTKILVIKAKKKLVLGPQTYGPYHKGISKIMAKYILKHAYNVCARDERSKQAVADLCKKEIKAYTDVAFVLPYETSNKNASKKAGINVSGLLWSGGYNGQNQFGLKVDYQNYIKKTIEILQDQGYEIHIISHVITKNPNSVENDLTAANKVKEIYPNAIVAPEFKTPMDAKSYIADMDIFLGARMHATIGAVSANVPTIPFSYSRKFEGLFGTLEYPYTINATEISTEMAIEKTKEYIAEIKKIKSDLKHTGNIIEKKVKQLEEWTSNIVEMAEEVKE